MAYSRLEAPPIRYAQTSDGVNIAYVVVGEGTPYLRIANPPFGIIEGLWQLLPEGIKRLGEEFQWVTFDARGTGLSQRQVTDISPQTLLADAEAVRGRLPMVPTVLNIPCDPINIGPALDLIKAHPGRFSHLILDAPWVTASDVDRTRYGQVLRVAEQLDWDTFTDVLARVAITLENEGVQTEDSEFYRRGVDHDVWAQYSHPFHRDVVPDLAALGLPTLVVAWTVAPQPVEAAQRVAARIHGAEFRVCSDPTFAEAAEFHLDFLRRTSSRLVAGVSASDALQPGSFRTLLFTDLEGHTAMMSRLGDTKGRAVLREHERITREALAAQGGQEVKTMGDGFMASFGSAQRALDCAAALQRAVADSIGGEALRIRAGINAGEPIAEDDDLFGSSVIAAARIAGKASGGQVLVSDVVRQLVVGKGFLFADAGIQELKGLDEPVRLWDLRWEGA
ncbi:MAG: adenylate/guanylate cyclase domain-containing protein [Dehalococcoidia bacterium]